MTDAEHEARAPDGPADADADDSAEAGADDPADRDRLARFLERLHTSQADPAVTEP